MRSKIVYRGEGEFDQTFINPNTFPGKESKMDDNKNRADVDWSKTVLLVLLGLIVGGALVWFYMQWSDSDTDDNNAPQNNITQVTNFNECADAGYTVTEDVPRNCTTPDGNTFTEEMAGAVKFNSNKGVVIELNDFQENKSVKSPLKITGMVPGNWSFEATFPVVLTGSDGSKIAEAQARLNGDWMTEELVPFEVNLEFETPVNSEKGILILRKDNPSGESEFDDAVEIPVMFE